MFLSGLLCPGDGSVRPPAALRSFGLSPSLPESPPLHPAKGMQDRLGSIVNGSAGQPATQTVFLLLQAWQVLLAKANKQCPHQAGELRQPSNDVLPVVMPLLAGVAQEVQLSQVVQRCQTGNAGKGGGGHEVHGQVDLRQGTHSAAGSPPYSDC